MALSFKVACLQTRCLPDAESALQHALGLADQAVQQGAQFLLLPEYCGGLRTEGKAFAPPVYTEQSHPVLIGLQQFARDRGVWILVGSVAIAADSEVAGEAANSDANQTGTGVARKYINRSFLLNDQGLVCARYDKLHLFDIQLSSTKTYKESATVQPGNKAILVDTPFGRLGLSICYDIRFPSLYRELSQAGAQLLLVPAAFTQRTGAAHWHVLNQARAIENGAYLIAPCAIGPVEGGGASYGHSLVIDPWGVIVADAGEQSGVCIAEINLDNVTKTREKIPSLAHDTPYELEHISLVTTVNKALA